MTKFTLIRGSLEKEIELPYLLQPIVEAIEPLSAASLAGLEIGDVFLTVEGKKLRDFNDLRKKIINSEGKVMKVTIFRDGKTLQKSIRPVLGPIEDSYGNFDTIYRIGVAGGPIFYPHTKTPSVWQALILGIKATKGVIVASFKGVKGIVSGKVEIDYKLKIDKDNATFVSGGTCAAMRAISVAHTLGFRNFKLYGFDCSVPEPKNTKEKD